MKLRILKSIFVIAAVMASTYFTSTAALFTDSAVAENNTFATGSVDLKLFYSCPGTVVTYDVAPGTSNGAVVECPFLAPNDGSNEADSLQYDSTDGADYNVVAGGDIYNHEGAPSPYDWTTTSGWWDGLSSAMDHTNVYPGWSNASDLDMVSVGNAGTLPVDLTATFAYEAQDVNETLEPLDGVVPGGDRVDPLTDANWLGLLGKSYSTALGDVVNVNVERVDNTGAVLNTSGATTLSALAAGVPVTLGTLNPDEVAWVRLNFNVDSSVDNTYQNRVFDYGVTFTAANQTP